jgi:hypothetical protein
MLITGGNDAMTTGKQVQIYLPPDAASRLFALAQQECRRPNEQARYMLLRALLGNVDKPANDNTGAVRQDTHAGVAPNTILPNCA